MKVKAAVVREKSGKWILEDLELEEPKEDEVLIRIVATGLCQTDVHVRDQELPSPLPIVLGHEGAGIVEKIGNSVSKVKEGDHVILTFPSCGQCANCLGGRPSYCVRAFEACFGGHRLDGTETFVAKDNPVHGAFFQQSSFATFALATERNVVKVREDAPLELLGPLGCGIQTGAGAVFNVLRPHPGDSIAVFGTGAVGLSAVMAAKVAGCTTIIAVDINDQRLELARELGATHSINGKKQNVTEVLRDTMPDGLHYSVDTTARPDSLRVAVECLRPLGVCGHVGGAALGTDVQLDMNSLLGGRTARGIVQGDSVPDIFISSLVELFMNGQFPFDRLVRYYDLADINQAADDARSGETIKPVLRMSGLL